MRVQFPSVEQVEQLPFFLRKTIPPEYEDMNGHVNIRHYLGLYDEAGWPFFALLGLDASYFTVQRQGMFDLEHHLHYVAELHVGDVVAIHGRLLARTAKRIHGMWFILNETRKQLSNTFEFVTSHADLNARRTSPFPDVLAARIDAVLAEHAKLEWAAPVCGIMGA
jgi:acyl-CoA thioester hydrolase